MKKCNCCGGDRFVAHQLIRADVIVNGRGDFEENFPGGLEAAVYDSERPYGPFTCTVCGAEYNSLNKDAAPLNYIKTGTTWIPTSKIDPGYAVRQVLGSKTKRTANTGREWYDALDQLDKDCVDMWERILKRPLESAKEYLSIDGHLDEWSVIDYSTESEFYEDYTWIDVAEPDLDHDYVCALLPLTWIFSQMPTDKKKGVELRDENATAAKWLKHAKEDTIRELYAAALRDDVILTKWPKNK